MWDWYLAACQRRMPALCHTGLLKQSSKQIVIISFVSVHDHTSCYVVVSVIFSRRQINKHHWEPSVPQRSNGGWTCRPKYASLRTYVCHASRMQFSAVVFWIWNGKVWPFFHLTADGDGACRSLKKLTIVATLASLPENPCMAALKSTQGCDVETGASE
jgi:hypothetical protein